MGEMIFAKPEVATGSSLFVHGGRLGRPRDASGRRTEWECPRAKVVDRLRLHEARHSLPTARRVGWPGGWKTETRERKNETGVEGREIERENVERGLRES